MLLFDVASDCAHGRLVSRFRDSWLSPADDAEPAGAAIGALFVGENQRHPDIGTAHQWEMEVFRHNADDGIRFAVQLDDCVDQFRFEVLSPQSVADDGYV